MKRNRKRVYTISGNAESVYLIKRDPGNYSESLGNIPGEFITVCTYKSTLAQGNENMQENGASG